ncbi:2-dehydro-3-deoxy-6-phosphogalactonate aldolase [Victivallis sp. Marseille-Q1083]|uniref:2-dehydro-3-deoxy-6-phosphogalactonate aldolase n=1 Tax=Victivallis sp. Marseille-Q1083 TaxID=2717288 RepID=UPI00158DA2E7|nr:2-dehydro-3-deoxy-6-phosphogalactonate aldolase [Victivallis sp. Marseille-Q1083]
MIAGELAECLAEKPLIGILRHISPSEIIAVCRLLEARGFRLLEIPLNSPAALHSLSLAAGEPRRRYRVGAGTVLSAAQVKAAAAAGAEFILAPDCNPEVIRAARAAQLVTLPGFMTPTEAFTAIRAGADFLKCFPAARLGAAYLRDLNAVLDKPVIAVGGIGADNLTEWLEAAAGVGLGNSLYRRGITLDELACRAEIFRQKI